MEKKKYILFIRNKETNELKQTTRTACTIDEAEDKLLNGLSYPWTFARYETTEYYFNLLDQKGGVAHA